MFARLLIFFFFLNLLFAQPDEDVLIEQRPNELNITIYFMTYTTTWTLPSDTFPDLIGIITYTAELQNGSPLPNWITFSGRLFTFYRDMGASFPVSITVEARDSIEQFATFTFSVRDIVYFNQNKSVYYPLAGSVAGSQKIIAMELLPDGRKGLLSLFNRVLTKSNFG